jgi:putative ABC transport system substrate-binding protein
LTGIVPDIGLEVWEKRFELLREVVPTASTVAFPLARRYWESQYAHAVRAAALKVAISLRLVAINTIVDEAELRRAFAAIRGDRFDAVAIADIPHYSTHRQLIVKLVEDLRLPAVYSSLSFVKIGGLLAYSPDYPSLFRHAAHQVDQILKGAKPGTIPFYRSTTLYVGINLKTAKALGLTVPQTVLIRADEIVE